jgi:hypothetical protein
VASGPDVRAVPYRTRTPCCQIGRLQVTAAGAGTIPVRGGRTAKPPQNTRQHVAALVATASPSWNPRSARERGTVHPTGPLRIYSCSSLAKALLVPPYGPAFHAPVQGLGSVPLMPHSNCGISAFGCCPPRRQADRGACGDATHAAYAASCARPTPLPKSTRVAAAEEIVGEVAPALNCQTADEKDKVWNWRMARLRSAVRHPGGLLRMDSRYSRIYRSAT